MPQSPDQAQHAQPSLGLPLPQMPAGRMILLQRSNLAGFRHHEAPLLWSALRPGAPLDLVREADNPSDADAVAIYWQGRKLGYLPRGENLMAASLLDRRRGLSARIHRLAPRGERNRRLLFEVLMPHPESLLRPLQVPANQI
jgi:hypothetical protein